MKHQENNVTTRRGLLALSPLIVFLLLYVGLSTFVGDFYKVPLSVAFVLSSVWGVATTMGLSLSERLKVFSRGAANSDVIYMVWIFILAGAFATLAQKVGATDATVNLALKVLPAGYLMPGLFLAACFISMAVGTSVGTVVALTPVAVGIAGQMGGDIPVFVAAVVGGSFFGDNLSFISDTTIASTRSQGCSMRDKFYVNIWLTLPAALAILVIYFVLGGSVETHVDTVPVDWQLIVPYLLVIVLAVAGLNVLLVLLIGIVAAFASGLVYSGAAPMDMLGFMGQGVDSMGNLIVVTLLASGMLGLIHYNGGIRFLISRMSKGIKGSRGAQAMISLLVAIVNLCTANNTIAIITVGSLARQISEKYGLDPRKTASLLDTCSCVAQCFIPYGAQVLMAASLAGITTVSILPHLYYPFALGLMVALSIIFQFPKRYNAKVA